jgi:hypothetical protein
MKDLKNKIKSMDYSTQTKFRVVLWFIFILFFVGLGLIWVFYGRSAAVTGFFCLLGAGVPVGLITIFLLGLDLFVKKSQ